MMLNEEPQPEGYLLIDKPEGWTSFDVVKRLRSVSKVKKIGHAGTLDPLATGLLIICFGKHTKKIEYMQGKPKEYVGSFVLGATTESYDLEKPVQEGFPIDHITPVSIDEAVASLTGDVDQVPPLHSAVKVKGKRAYEHARKGKTLELKSRRVNISRFDVDQSDFPILRFTIGCSKGTYIRSIARDLGRALGTGAYMSSLRRTAIGEFNVDDAVHITDIKTQEDFFKLAQRLSD